MIKGLALARYSPYLKHSYINNQGAIRWYPSKPANDFHFKSVLFASGENNRKLSVNLGKLTFRFNILVNQSDEVFDRFLKNHLVHKNFTSDVYKLVSVPYYDNISFNPLPKRNVDYFNSHYQYYLKIFKHYTLKITQVVDI